VFSLVGAALVAGLLGGAAVGAQVAQGAAPPAAPRQPARAAAPIDLAGTWAQVVTEDWQWRFITPAVGDYTSVPITAEAKAIADAWNPDADTKAGQQCKAFGAAAIMRLPTRMQISWVDDETLKLDWDLGTQSRLVYFDKKKQPGAPSLQGHAVAEWIDTATGGRGGRGGAAPAGRAGAPAAAAAGDGRGAAPGRGGAAGRGGRGAAPAPRPGGLKMVTTNLTPQYLRMNGVPISEEATVTEYMDIVPGPNGDQWLIVRTTVEDPQFLSQPYIVSQQFKKEPNNSKWNPTPCELLPRAKGTATQVPGGAGE
jgi:hypothetical protein